MASKFGKLHLFSPTAVAFGVAIVKVLGALIGLIGSLGQMDANGLCLRKDSFYLGSRVPLLYIWLPVSCSPRFGGELSTSLVIFTLTLQRKFMAVGVFFFGLI